MTANPVIRLRGSKEEAERASIALENALDLEALSLASFETGPAEWTVEVYGSPGDDARALQGQVREALAGAGIDRSPEIDSIAQQDWVTASLAGLSPVRAGRVVVHGAHDREKIVPGTIGIEIEAALAFGTGHHGTTRGCLLAIQDALKRRRPRQALDLGTGTGVLAIAIARLAHCPVLATDIDPVAVDAARGNARFNRADELHIVVAKGFSHPRLRDAQRARSRKFDLVVANILAEPLVGMATDISRVLAPGGVLVLSGLMAQEGPRIRATYRNRGFVFRRGRVLDGWATLEFRQA